MRKETAFSMLSMSTHKVIQQQTIGTKKDEERIVPAEKKFPASRILGLFICPPRRVLESYAADSPGEGFHRSHRLDPGTLHVSRTWDILDQLHVGSDDVVARLRVRLSW